jgi:hypothetical protein
MEPLVKLKLSRYLFHRLQQCGADYTSGIPGDFALPLYNDQAEFGLKTIDCAHEPGCVYAADAYSRLKGLGARISGGAPFLLRILTIYSLSWPQFIIARLSTTTSIPLIPMTK